MPTKPILLLSGVKGGGKSFTLRGAGKLLFGREWDLSCVSIDNEKDMKVAASHKAFIAIDNADSSIKWLNDFLAKIATGEAFEYRKLYTNNDVLVVKPDCFVALTARTPRFRRDDVAERMLILKLKPLKENFCPEYALLREIEKNRELLWAEIIQKLQSILQKLKENNNHRYTTRFRMADFYAFAGAIFGEEVVKPIFSKMQREQFNFSLEEDPIFELIQFYVDGLGDISENEYKTAKQLFSENYRIIFPCKTVKSLATKLKHLWEGLLDKFDCEIQKGHSLKYRIKSK